MNAPLLITEQMIVPFKFWLDGQLQDGMRCGADLFRHYQTFNSDRREQAYSLAWALAENGVQVAITVCNANYRLWLGLRAQAETTPMPQVRHQPTAQPTVRAQYYRDAQSKLRHKYQEAMVR